jgi:hypothetical protein
MMAVQAANRDHARADGRQDVHIGVILVHGIGEHRRFEHLDGELRPLIAALVRRGEVAGDAKDSPRPPSHVTVEIIEGSASTLHADQDTWSMESGAPVRVIVRDGDVRKHIHFHEVWWADVNEPYSLWKQIKFWSWGLSIWLIPSKLDFDLPGAKATMALPAFPPDATESVLSLRTRLFCVCNVFAMAAFSLGALIFFAKRVFGFAAPSIVKIFVNYIGAVKLYSQRKRSDGGFLDAYKEPPRVSIRRRMIRTIAEVALARYDRWYVFAHSLGSVVAFNGLMENAHAIPNYLSEEQYKRIKQRVNGQPQSELGGRRRTTEKDGINDFVGPTQDMLPARPLWLANDEVVYRDRFFDRFRGLLTYGSPLDKFAAIWPARVPINIKEPGLVLSQKGERSEWINIYDPTDPVAANLDAFAGPNGADPNIILEPKNFAYASHPVLLLSHLHYFDGKQGRTDRLPDLLMEWILSGQSIAEEMKSHKYPWLSVQSWRYRIRRRFAFATWILAYLFLTFLGALSLPLWKSLLFGGGGALGTKIGELWRNWFTPRTTLRLPWLEDLAVGIWKVAEVLYTLAIKWWLDPLVAGVLWVCGVFVAVFGPEPDGLLTRMAKFLGLPAVIEEMIKLSLGVMIFVGLAGLIGWLFVFDKEQQEGPSAPAPLVLLARWWRQLLTRMRRRKKAEIEVATSSSR